MCKQFLPGFIIFGSLVLYSVKSMKSYVDCPYRLDIAMVSLYSLILMCYFFTLGLVSSRRACPEITFSLLLMLDLGLMAANFVVSFTMLVLIEFKRKECVTSKTVFVSNWIVCGMGMLIIVSILVSLMVWLCIACKEVARRRRARREIKHMFEVIYNPKFNVEKLIAKYAQQLRSEPIMAKELAIIKDYFTRKYEKDQESIDEDQRDCCIICLEQF